MKGGTVGIKTEEYFDAFLQGDFQDTLPMLDGISFESILIYFEFKFAFEFEFEFELKWRFLYLWSTTTTDPHHQLPAPDSQDFGVFLDPSGFPPSSPSDSSASRFSSPSSPEVSSYSSDNVPWIESDGGRLSSSSLSPRGHFEGVMTSVGSAQGNFGMEYVSPGVMELNSAMLTPQQTLKPHKLTAAATTSAANSRFSNFLSITAGLNFVSIPLSSSSFFLFLFFFSHPKIRKLSVCQDGLYNHPNSKV